jgi:hypothetical protein
MNEATKKSGITVPDLNSRASFMVLMPCSLLCLPDTASFFATALRIGTIDFFKLGEPLTPARK